MNRMSVIAAAFAALTGGVAVATAQQPASPPARRPRASAQQSAPQAERLVVYKSPT